MTKETTIRWYRVERSRISFVKFILEAYDNVAVMSTIDPREAVVRITVAPGCVWLVDGIMTALANEFEVVPMDSVCGTDPAGPRPGAKHRGHTEKERSSCQ